MVQASEQEQIERAEDVRNLAAQIDDLKSRREEQAGIVFRDMSSNQRKVTIYSMETGEPVKLPYYYAERAIATKRLPDGSPMFTARKDNAPEYKRGNVKCFLHPESPDRPALQDIGLAGATCSAAHLANNYSRRIHAQHRHRNEWEAYQEYLKEIERMQLDERNQRQLDATLALARTAAGKADRE